MYFPTKKQNRTKKKRGLVRVVQAGAGNSVRFFENLVKEKKYRE